MNAAILLLIAAQSIRPFSSMREAAIRPDQLASPMVIDTQPFARTVTCTGTRTLTGTAKGAGAVSWSASPDGASGACTGTTSWSCPVAVSPNAAGEGVETITVSQAGGGSVTVDIGFYVSGAHSCFLAQSFDGAYNSGKVDLDAVGTWVNLGSSALNVTQATGSAQPTYRTSIVVGQPVVRCDGGDNLAAATASDWTFLHDGTGATAQAIAATSSSEFGTIFATSRLNDRGFTVRDETTFKVAAYTHDSTSITLTAASANNAILTGKYHDLTYTNASASTPDVSSYVDNVVVASGTPSAVSALAPSNPLTICKLPASSTSPFTGDLFRVLIYTSELSSTSRDINKQTDEWALGGTLPVTP